MQSFCTNLLASLAICIPCDIKKVWGRVYSIQTKRKTCLSTKRLFNCVSSIACRVCNSQFCFSLRVSLRNLIFNIIANGLTNMMNECACTHIHSFMRYPIYRFIFNNFFTGARRGARSAGKYLNARTQLLMHSTGVLMHNDYAGSMASGKWNRKHQQANYGSVSS